MQATFTKSMDGLAEYLALRCENRFQFTRRDSDTIITKRHFPLICEESFFSALPADFIRLTDISVCQHCNSKNMGYISQYLIGKIVPIYCEARYDG